MSAIFFKFKSQKDPQRITFDGNSLSVFEIKREIIRISQLGDGTDFDLSIYDEGTNDEYDDDTATVHRSSTVIARRLPAAKNGQGRAARYVAGRMPTASKNSHRREFNQPTASSRQGMTSSNGPTAMEQAQTEEGRIAALFQSDQWQQQQQQMASATHVHRQAKGGKDAPPSDKTLPPDYVCYRCGVKGHFIQVCPTNDDPAYDNRQRVQRTSGIPRSMLKPVEQSTATDEDGLTDDARKPTSRWVDADGNAVAAVPDTAAWQKYQANAKASAARAEVEAQGDEELRELELECPIDKRMFVDPMKTPCCERIYCHECIENALIERDLVCPGCATEGILLDSLIPDELTVDKILIYEEEKRLEKIASSKADSPGKPHSSTDNKKKRAADEELANDRQPDAPKPQAATNAIDQNFINQMNALANASSHGASHNNTMLPINVANAYQLNNIGAMAQQFAKSTSMPHYNPMNMPTLPTNVNMAWPNNGNNGIIYPGNGMNGMGFPGTQQQHWNQMGVINGGWPSNNYNSAMMYYPQQTHHSQNNTPLPQHARITGMPPTGPAAMANRPNIPTGPAGFPSQQFSGGGGNQENSAYIRQPMNPERHAGKAKRARPADYREI